MKNVSTSAAGDLSLKVSMVIKAPIESIWESLVDPQKSKKYFWDVTITSDFKVGSPITWEGVWEGKSFVDKGTILAITKPTRFQYNYWSSFSGVPDEKSSYLTVTYTLEPQTGGTVLTSIAQDKSPTQEAKEHSTANWTKMLETIKKDLES